MVLCNVSNHTPAFRNSKLRVFVSLLRWCFRSCDLSCTQVKCLLWLLIACHLILLLKYTGDKRIEDTFEVVFSKAPMEHLHEFNNVIEKVRHLHLNYVYRELFYDPVKVNL